MIILRRGEFEARTDVVWLQKWIILQDLFPRGAVGEQFQDIFDSQPIPPNTRAATALSGVDRDTGEQGVHAATMMLVREKGKAFNHEDTKLTSDRKL
jgi:hypothetical protein